MAGEVVITFMRQLVTVMTINYCYDQIWEITIVFKLSYDLTHEPVPKLMSSCDLVPIRNKLAAMQFATSDLMRMLTNHSQQRAKFFVHSTVSTYLYYVCIYVRT